MKRFLLLFAFVSFIGSVADAQCDPDGTLPADFIGISPLADSQEPCDTLVPSEIAYKDATVAYSSIITVTIPAEISGVQLVDVSLKPADDPNPGLTGLPDGLTYTCNPPTCVFAAGDPGCVEISGFVGADVEAQIYDLLITASVNAGLLAGDVRFPLPDDPADYTTIENLLGGFGFAFPECPYQLRVDETNSNQSVFESKVSVAQNMPNPFSNVTTIAVNAEAGDYSFSVFNTVGELVHNRELTLNGQENIEFDASNLSAGIYFYTISNTEGSITKRMIVK